MKKILPLKKKTIQFSKAWAIKKKSLLIINR